MSEKTVGEIILLRNFYKSLFPFSNQLYSGGTLGAVNISNGKKNMPVFKILRAYENSLAIRQATRLLSLTGMCLADNHTQSVTHAHTRTHRANFNRP